MASGRQAPLTIGGKQVAAGDRALIELPLSLLSDHTPLSLPIQVVHGARAGSRLFLCAAIHGDEVNGVEIIRRVLRLAALRRMRGTLLAVPVVNVMGFINRTRYLPDRRDLNRSFPGSARGSLASQVAHLFMTEVVARSTHGIDLHTGAIHRSNLPQIRADLGDDEVRRMALVFGAPVVIDAALRDGSLREAARERGVRMLLYEAGQALRFDEVSIRAGVRGVLRVMRELGMLPPRLRKQPPVQPVVARSSSWTRAPASGMLRTVCRLGASVAKEQLLGVIADPFGQSQFEVRSEVEGIVIGRSNIPVVNQGDALFHIARVTDSEAAAETVGLFQDEIEDIADFGLL